MVLALTLMVLMAVVVLVGLKFIWEDESIEVPTPSQGPSTSGRDLMRLGSCSVVALSLLALLFSDLAWADYQAGLNAYRNGDYATERLPHKTVRSPK